LWQGSLYGVYRPRRAECTVWTALWDDSHPTATSSAWTLIAWRNGYGTRDQLDDQPLLDAMQIGRWTVKLAGRKLNSAVTFSRKGRELSPAPPAC